MKFFFLYKTTNLVDGRVFYGIHPSEDLFFGTEFSEDLYCGKNLELISDVRKYGPHMFRVESIRAFPIEKDAIDALERYKPLATYKHGNSRPASSSTRFAMSLAKSGEKNPMAGKQHKDVTKAAMAEYRRRTRWINNGTESRQIGKTDPVPDGWALGRIKSGLGRPKKQ